MSTLQHILSFLFAGSDTRPSAEDAYLAEASDLYDLERRMRILDERGRQPLPGFALGLFAR